MAVPKMKVGARNEVTRGPWKDGIDEKTEPGQLGNSLLMEAQNVLLDETPGRVVQNNGARAVANLPAKDPLLPLPPKYGYSFKKSDGTEYFVLSDGITIYSTEDLVTFTERITGLDSDGYLQFETAEEKCWIINGIDDNMWFDGTNFVVMDREATDGVTENTSDSTIEDTTHRGGVGEADDYWNNRKVVITSGTYAGMEGRVTDFVKATGILTISGFTAAPDIGDTYSVGLIMPKGRIIRYEGNHMFIGATTENRSEVRFTRLDDLDTGFNMSIDNPRAWPSAYQLEITQDDGDQVWSFSPLFRDRILVSKGTALYRIEPNATYVFVPVLVSGAVGCRYPDSWVVKNELLYFLGSEVTSGILDMYKTDMVSVKPVHKEGRLLPTFDDMYRAEPVYRYISRASADQFNTGDKSTTLKASLGRLECKEFDTDSDWNDIKDTFTNIDASGDALAIQSIPDWVANYDPGVSTGGAGDPNDLPAAASPVWSKVTSGMSEVIDSGALKLQSSGGYYIYYYREVDNSAKNTFFTIRFKTNFNYLGGKFLIRNGSKEVEFESSFTDPTGWYVNGVKVADVQADVYHYFTILLDEDDNGKVWLDGVKVWEDVGRALDAGITSVVGVDNAVMFAFEDGTLGSGIAYFDLVKYDDDFNYKVSDMPDTLPAVGTAVVKFDYTRTPDAFGKLFSTLELNGGTVGIKTASSANGVDYEAYVALTNGQEPGVDNATTVAQHLKVEFTLTRADIANGPVLEKLMCGALWRMTGQLVGSNIVQWRKWLDEDTTPAGTSIVKKVRLATTVAAPIEAEWGAWTVITDSDNIGTILGEADPVVVAAGESRWIDAKVELYPSAAGVTPNLENLLINWVEGSDAKLALTSIIYKKRLYLTAISRTAETNDLVLVLDSNDSWTKMVGLSLYRQVGFRGLIYGLSSVDDKIFQMDIPGLYSYGGTAIDAFISTGALDFGNDRYEVIKVKVGNGDITSTVLVYLSTNGKDWTLKGTINFTAEGTYNLRIKRGYIGYRHFTRLRVAAAEGMEIRMLKQEGQLRSEK